VANGADYLGGLRAVKMFFESFKSINHCRIQTIGGWESGCLMKGSVLADPPSADPPSAQPPPSMTAQQILEAIGPELRNQIFTYIQTDERPAYRAVINSLAGARKLRPQFILEKSRQQQAEWLHAQLGMKTNGPVVEQILQIWLLKSQGAMLITFLDTVGIEHDGKGQVEELPEEIAEDKAAAGVQALLAAYPSKQVALYLHMFQVQRPEGWPGLTKAIEANPAAKL
jgi:hypothetical protein